MIPVKPTTDASKATAQKPPNDRALSSPTQQSPKPSPSSSGYFNHPAASSSKAKFKGSKLPGAIRHITKKATPAPGPSTTTSTSPTASQPTPFLIILEEGTDVPVFWNGENPSPMIKWGPSLDQEANLKLTFGTVQDFLSFYAAGRYLRKCSMSLQASSTKYISDLKLSDPFSKIMDHYNKDGRPVTLLLTHSGEEEESGYSKFTLFVRENSGKKVLWNGNIPTNKMVAKLNQSDMGLKIETCLQNYVARGYLSQNCQVDLVKECSDTIPRTSREELIPISMQALVSSLFKGNSASIVIRSKAGNDSQAASQTDISQSSATRIAVFAVPPSMECNWLGKTWGEIKHEVRDLVNGVEVTLRDTILATDVFTDVLEKKRTLEIAIRRRSRVVDEVWRAYQALRTIHNEILAGNANSQSSGTVFRRVRPASQVVVIGGGAATVNGGDLDNTTLQVQQSCIDFLSSSLIQYGLELEIYDEESQGLSRIAGFGFGVAIVVAICTVVYYC